MTEILSPTLSRTLEALEVRLSRLEYLLSQGDETHTGSADSQRLPPPDATVSTRIANTEIRFSALISRFSAYGDILRLTQAHPELFDGDSAEDERPLTTAEKLAVVNANAPAYPTTSSRLTSLEDSPMPSVDSSVSLIAVASKIARAEHRMQSQMLEVEALRSRTAMLLHRWYEVDVLGGSECWAEWESRLMEIEKTVRRKERQIEQDVKASDVYASTT